MNPRDELMLEIRNWLDTWAPNCGAPRAVFEGQFRALIAQIAETMKAGGGVDAYDLIEIVKRACKT